MTYSATAGPFEPATPLDEIDRKILRLLQSNGRMTNSALAEAVGLTATPMLQRIKKLEQRGVITGYAALVDRTAVGQGTMAFVHVKLAKHQLSTHKRFLATVSAFPEVLECHHVAGEDDFLLKVVVRDIGEYEHFLLYQLTKSADIDRVRTTFVLSTGKADTAIPIDE
ncbi:MAG TPA: Lrp/AsnC family transcriptional regulator [Blastocatellia bacterium]|nr:Lrp/AsnC family transcriptional regulator [Blastocatellia bacterium]